MVENEQTGKLRPDPEDKKLLADLLDKHGRQFYTKKVQDSLSEAAAKGTAYTLPDDPWEKSWTLVSVADMFKVLSTEDENLYERSYRDMSEWIYWGPRALHGAMNQTEWGTEGFTEQDWRAASMALVIGCKCLLEAIHLLNWNFQLGREQDVQAIADELGDVLSSAMELAE